MSPPYVERKRARAHRRQALRSHGHGSQLTAHTLTYAIVGGSVQASIQDANGLVGLTVGVYDNFWSGYENAISRTDCEVIARCIRPFRHPDGTCCLTYLIEYDDRYWPISHLGLLSCLTREARASLPAQRGA